MRAEHRPPRHPPVQDRVEVAEQPRRGGRDRRAVRQVDEAPAGRHGLVRDRRESRAGVAEGQLRPHREVAVRRRPVRGEVAAGQPLQRRSAVERLGRRAEPLLREDHAVLAVAHRPADQAVPQGRGEQHVHERLPGGRHPGGVERAAQLLPRPRPVLRDLGDHRRDAALREHGVDPLLLQAPRRLGRELRGREVVQPPEVLGGHEVQGSAVQPRDDEAAPLGERRVDVRGDDAPGPRAHGEPEAPRVLPLHREHAAHRVLRARRGLPAQQLGGAAGGHRLIGGSGRGRHGVSRAGRPSRRARRPRGRARTRRRAAPTRRGPPW